MYYLPVQEKGRDERVGHEVMILNQRPESVRTHHALWFEIFHKKLKVDLSFAYVINLFGYFI